MDDTTDGTGRPGPAGHWAETGAEWRAHWPVGLATFLALGLGSSVFANISSLFILPLHEAFGWSRGQIALANNATVVLALLNPAIGRLIDRIGAQRVILAGFAGVGLAWTGLALMPGTLAAYYLLFAALSLCGFATSGVGFSRAIAGVFVRSRGFSLAVGRAGLALAAWGLPLLLYTAMVRWGWRAGYATMAGLTLLVAIPAVWFGLRPHHPAAAGSAAPMPAAPPAAWRALARDPRTIAIALGAAGGYLPLLATISQLQPLLIGLGTAPASAAGMVGLLGLAALFGAFATGVLLDRGRPTTVAAAIMALSAVGMGCLLLAPHDPRLAIGGVLLLGVSQGAEIDIVAFLIARYFPMRDFGSVFGLCTVAITIGSVAGMVGIGLLYDRTGGYGPALGIGAGFFLSAALCYLLLGRLAPHASAHDLSRD